MRGEGGQGLAGVLGRRHRQHQVAAAERGEVARGLDGVVQAHARQVAGVLALGLDMGGDLGPAAPQARFQPCEGADLGQGGAPGAGVDHPCSAHHAREPEAEAPAPQGAVTASEMEKSLRRRLHRPAACAMRPAVERAP